MTEQTYIVLRDEQPRFLRRSWFSWLFTCWTDDPGKAARVPERKLVEKLHSMKKLKLTAEPI